MNRVLPYLGSAPAVLLVATIVVMPLLLLVRVSLYAPPSGRGFFAPGTVTWENYQVLMEPDGLRILVRTAACGVLVATLVLAAAFPLAIFVQSLESAARSVALALILIPKTAGLLATLLGLQRILPRGLAAAILAETCLVLPYAVLVLWGQLLSHPPACELAARGLGASHWQVWRRITLPLSMPGIILAFELSLVWGTGAFLGPLFLAGPDDMTLSVELHRQAFEYGRWPRAAAEAVGLLGLIGGALVLTWLAARRWQRVLEPGR